MVSSSGDAVHGGDFGSTARTSIQVTGHNGRVFRAQAYRCVNVTTDPELRDALDSGAIFEVESADGAESFRLALPVQYHDEELELFALVIPDELRYREFALRQELLDELGHIDSDLPDYMREFHTVCGVDALQVLEQRRAAGEDVSSGAGNGELAADGGMPLDSSGAEQQAELDQAWRDIEKEREQLEREREQLDEVAARFDRERSRMDEVEDELAQERESLGELRSEIEAMKLNLEQERMRLDQGAPASNAEESTQVVTDDQFIEVVEGGEDGDEASDEGAETLSEASDEDFAAAPHEATELIESPYAGHPKTGHPNTGQKARGADLDHVRIEQVDSAGVKTSFEDVGADDRTRHVAVVDGRVLASAKLSKATLEAVEQSGDLAFFVQRASDTGYPHVGLVLAALDDEQHAEASVGWPLDITNPDHELALDRLAGSVELLAALYGDDGELAAVFDIRAPLHQNLEWIRQDVERQLTDPNREGGSFEEAAATWAADDHERLGSMRHNFEPDSFEEATTPAEIMLACGIVGYWSAPEKFAYLVSNRSFPLDQFEAIQSRVVRRAVQHGLYLNADLRRVAVDLGLASDSVDLVERLLSEFAELSIGLRDNDLDPIQEWENWDALVELAEDLGVTPDPDVLELAESSLKRAQDFQETDLADDASAPMAFEDVVNDGGQSVAAPSDERGHAAFEVDDLVVARRSETTGVTYFLPDDAVLDTFDDLASMPREDLERLLEDAKGRLEAAQMIIERFGSEGVQVALDGAEKMMTSEVVALARFVETKAEGLEAELVRCVESGGPSATYVAGQALASIRSTPAIPTLLDAFRDERRRGNKEQLARAIAAYGEKLLPPLKRAIKKDGHDDAIVMLLRELERQHEGILGELAKDRSKNVRNAAAEARAN
jgi:hypothetical protein